MHVRVCVQVVGYKRVLLQPPGAAPLFPEAHPAHRQMQRVSSSRRLRVGLGLCRAPVIYAARRPVVFGGRARSTSFDEINGLV